MSPTRYLAQINVSTARWALDDPRMAGFTGALDAVNAVAERSAGFVWRLKDDSGNATGIHASEDPRFLVNMSVWETPEALQQFVWKTVHNRIYSQRAEWFPKDAAATLALWWIEPGTVPTLEEGLARLEHLRRDGPSADVFGWEGLGPAFTSGEHRDG